MACLDLKWQGNGVEGNGLDEGNLLRQTLMVAKKSFSLGDIVVPINGEHSSTISGNFTEIHYILCFTNHIHSDIEGEKNA